MTDFWILTSRVAHREIFQYEMGACARWVPVVERIARPQRDQSRARGERCSNLVVEQLEIAGS